jgi:tRNA threonylcarbamoyladenosine biosynthesis protein TsaE
MILITGSVQETRSAGARFSKKVRSGDVVVLDGELGCGKTEFVRGIVGSLNPSIIVRSPSFSIVNTYLCGTINLYHFDFYRIEKASRNLMKSGFQSIAIMKGPVSLSGV